jgi:hypothetical protein
MTKSTKSIFYKWVIIPSDFCVPRLFSYNKHRHTVDKSCGSIQTFFVGGRLYCLYKTGAAQIFFKTKTGSPLPIQNKINGIRIGGEQTHDYKMIDEIK